MIDFFFQDRVVLYVRSLRIFVLKGKVMLTGLSTGAIQLWSWPWKREISEDLKVTLVNQQCVVYEFKCYSCDANYIGYTSRYLHLRTDTP